MIDSKGSIRKSHEQYVKEVSDININIEVVGQYVNNVTKITHRCLIDEHEWLSCPRDILSGCGCPVCGKKVIGNAPSYINSIWASDFKDYLSQFLTEEQMKEYMPYSSKDIIAKCPNCNTTKKTTPALLIRRGIKCQGCSDGVSYPNKFGRCFIKQIYGVDNIQFEYSPDWLIVNNNKCFFDIYFEYKNAAYIIELDGKIGHGYFEYNTANNEKYGVTQDLVKEQLASKHGVHVIRIDARVSSCDYIRNSIMNSELVDILNLKETDIDWNLCANFAVSSLAVSARDLWEDGFMIKDISAKLDVSSSTVKRYLKQMVEVGDCTYSAEEARKRAGKLMPRNHGGREVICLSTKKVYQSIKDAAKDNNVSYDLVRTRCRRKGKDFRFYDDYLKDLNV